MSTNNTNTWFHFTGIAGVATGQLAVELKKQGHIVTGSDKGLFPPMSDHLINNAINIELGYKFQHLTSDYYKQKYGEKFNLKNKTKPDILVMQGAKGEKNNEYLFAKKNNIPIKYYPELIQEYVLEKDNSIVVAGTYGKTTTTSMLAWILIQAGLNPSYMFGGLSLELSNGVKFKSHDSSSLNPCSVIEGDEYIISPEMYFSKFFLYNPKYLVLTSCQWDHGDIFKTKEYYIDNFRKLVDMVPEDGVIVFNEEDQNVLKLIKYAKCKTIGYKTPPTPLDRGANTVVSPSKENFPNLSYPSVKGESTYSEYTPVKGRSTYSKYPPVKGGSEGGLKTFDVADYTLQILGDYNYSNAQAAYEMAKYLGIDKNIILKALESYKGIKRRLEIKFQDENLVVIDDFGASPSKAKAALKAIRAHFPNHEIFAIFEPNLGSRTKAGIDEYKETFKTTDQVYLPRFTNVSGDYLTNQDLGNYLESNGIKVTCEDNDDELVNKLKSLVNHHSSIIIFLGSHGFRGLINDLINTSS